MFNLICKSFPHLKYAAARISPTHKLYFIQINPFSASSSIFNPTTKPLDKPSFTVSYLINTCGFSPERALSASKNITLRKPDKPDSVFEFLKQHGFTETQISNLIKKFPPVLLCDPENTILPKLEFLTSKGLSTTDVTKIVSRTPAILKRSLENYIIPAFNYFASLLKSEEKAVHAFRRFGTLLVYSPQTRMPVNIDLLRELRVPEPNIMFLLMHQPRAFMTDPEKFKETVEEVKKMGFNPERIVFILAVKAIRAMSKITWEKKVEAYKKWGWSHDEVMTAFGKNPWCMIASEDKIGKTMDFMVNKMGWDSKIVAKRPVLMSLSLEKRIIPRCSVYQYLLSKDLLMKDISVKVFLESSEDCFLKRFVEPFEKEVPELLKIYQAKLALKK